MSIVRPDRINVKGGKGFSRSGIANVTKPMPAKSVAPAIATKGLTKKLMAMDKKAPFGNKFFLGQAPQQFGQFPKVRKKPMKKTASRLKTFANKYVPGVAQIRKGNQSILDGKYVNYPFGHYTSSAAMGANFKKEVADHFKFKEFLLNTKFKKYRKAYDRAMLDGDMGEVHRIQKTMAKRLKREGYKDITIGGLKLGTTIATPIVGGVGMHLKSKAKKQKKIYDMRRMRKRNSMKMTKTAAIYRMPKPRLPSPNSVVYGRRGSASKRLVKKPRKGAKPKVPNFMKGIVGFKQLPTYKPIKSPMTKYLKKRFKF